MELSYRGKDPITLCESQIRNIGRLAAEAVEKYQANEPFKLIIGRWVYLRWDSQLFPGIHIRHAAGSPGVYITPNIWNDLMKEFHAVLTQ